MQLADVNDIKSKNIRLTEREVENQYDYIRTTFSNLNPSFEYLNPDYKLVQMAEYVSSDNVVKPQMVLTNVSTETTADDSNSLAQILATQSYVPSVEEVQQESEQVVEQVEEKIEDVQQESEQVVEQVAEKVEEVQQETEQVVEQVAEKVEEVVEKRITKVKVCDTGESSDKHEEEDED